MPGARGAALVRRLACREHPDVLRDPALACLGLLGRLHAVQDRVAVLAAEFRERVGEAGRLERRGEVLGHSGGGHAVVRGLPAAVGLGPFDLGLAGRPHPARGDQRLYLLAVDLRPRALRAPRREALHEPVVVDAPRAPVDPAEAQRDVDGAGPVERRDAGVLLRHPDKHLVGVGGVGLQPGLEFFGSREELHVHPTAFNGPAAESCPRNGRICAQHEAALATHGAWACPGGLGARVADAAAPGPAGLTAALLDQLAKALEVTLDAPLGKPDRRADELGDAFGLERHLHLDTRGVVAERLEANDTVVALAAGCLPRDPLVGDLLGDRGVPVAHLARDLALPVQAAVVELLDLLDAAHEGRELLELRPLVIRRADRHVDDGALADRAGDRRTPLAQEVPARHQRDGDQRDPGSLRAGSTPTRLGDLSQQLSALARRKMPSDVGRTDDAHQAVTVDHRQAPHLGAFHRGERLANRVVGADRHGLALRELGHERAGHVLAAGDRPNDDVTIRQHPLQAVVLTADRHRSDAFLREATCCRLERIAGGHALGAAGHDVSCLHRWYRLYSSGIARGRFLRRGRLPVPHAFKLRRAGDSSTAAGAFAGRGDRAARATPTTAVALGEPAFTAYGGGEARRGVRGAP